jgi:aminopeptidase
MRTHTALAAGAWLLVLYACGPKPAPTKETASIPDTTSSTTPVMAATATPDENAAAIPAEQLTKLAHQVIGTSLAIHPADVVIIDGGKHTVDLMEAMAVEATKAGGFITMWLESDKVARAAFTEMPEKYLDQKPSFLADWFKRTTVYIALPSAADYKAIYADVPEAKLAKSAAAAQVIYDMLNSSPMRGAFIDYPSAAQAKLVGMPFARFSEMRWAAIGADNQQMATVAKALAAKLNGAKQVHVTSPGGTDLTFAIGKRTVIMNTGIVTPEAAKAKLILNRWVTLPGGSVSVALQEASVSGVIATPKDRCKFNPVSDARYEFTKGTLTKASAKQGDACVQEILSTYSPNIRRLGAMTIGLNPANKVVEEGAADYRPGTAAGFVTLSLGDNQLLGGSTKVPGAVTYDLPVTRATVVVDGQTIVQDGKLVTVEVASSAR